MAILSAFDNSAVGRLKKTWMVWTINANMLKMEGMFNFYMFVDE